MSRDVIKDIYDFALSLKLRQSDDVTGVFESEEDVSKDDSELFTCKEVCELQRDLEQVNLLLP